MIVGNQQVALSYLLILHKKYDIIFIENKKEKRYQENMNDFYEQQLYLWRDMACELREFIEYTLRLNSREEEIYNNIIKKYEEGED